MNNAEEVFKRIDKGAKRAITSGNNSLRKANNKLAAAALLGGLSIDWAVSGHGFWAGVAGGFGILAAGRSRTNATNAAGYFNRASALEGALAQYHLEKAGKDEEPPTGPGLTVA